MIKRRCFLPGLLLGITAALLIGGAGLHAGTTDTAGKGRSSAAFSGAGAGQTAGDIAVAALEEGALWSFAVLGDTRIVTAEEFEKAGGRGRGNRIFPELVALARSLSPAPKALFVLGDLGNKPGRPDHLRLFLEHSLPFLPGCIGFDPGPPGPPGAERDTTGSPNDAGRAGAAGPGPCLFALTGNHDVRDERSLQTYLQVIKPPGGRSSLALEVGGIRFLCLDSESVDPNPAYRLLYQSRCNARIDGEQERWLEQELLSASEKGQRVIVMLHRPLFPPPFAKNKRAGMDKHPEARDHLHRRFVERGVKAVFSSHDHFYHRDEKDGIVYVISGGGGAGLYAPEYNGGFYHFLYILVSPDGMHVYAVDVEGRVADEVVIQ